MIQNPYFNPYQQNFNGYQLQQSPAPTQDERIWVQNETSAEAYLVAPNSFVRLWDSTKPVFYEKKADASGRPYPMDIYEYKRRSPQMPTFDEKPTIDYVKEINALKERISALEGMRKGAKYDGKQSDGNAATVQSVQK